MTDNYSPPKINNKAFKSLAIVVIIGAVLTAIALLYPGVFTAILNFLWIMILISVAVFLVLGFLVIIGMKKEVGSFLDVMLEGSLTILDAAEILRKLYAKFVALLKDFIYFITPVLAIWVAAMGYLGLIFLYKSVGAVSDVTILTVVLTVALVVAVGVLNKPGEEKPIETWRQAVGVRFKNMFSDAFEVVIFIFFLTMDLENLFFLPENLRVPLEAHIGEFNLMLSGTDYSNQLIVTIYLVAFSIALEIVRNVIKVVAVAVRYYREMSSEDNRIENIKRSIRLSFDDAKDDLIKFITFTTFLILVFLLFPRLKLFAMIITSVTSLFMDLLIRERLYTKRGNDLISKILNKTFGLEG